MKKLLLNLIKWYQKIFSLDHGLYGKLRPNYRVCKFVPTCSQYGYEAIDRYGILKGGYLAVRRVLRCNYKTEAGTYDPVP